MKRDMMFQAARHRKGSEKCERKEKVIYKENKEEADQFNDNKCANNKSIRML